ncbi:hypothetical protein [Streptomyces sp. NPDC001135]
MRCAVPLAAVAVLLCAGCAATGEGTGDARPKTGSTPPGAAVRAAVARTGATSARLHERIEVAGEGKVYRLTITGGFDFGRGRGSVAVDFPGGAISHSDETFADGKVYIGGASGPDGGKWGVMPRDKAEAHAALRAPANDPEHVLRQISALRSVSREGEETVHGVRAVHYRGTLDHKTLTLRMARDVRAKMDRARDLLGDDIPVFADAWVDGRGRLVQTRMTLNLAGGRVEATMELSGLGTPVSVKTPRPDDTVPVSIKGGVLNG